jgi:putative addiction module component (TIGR02574 family)
MVADLGMKHRWRSIEPRLHRYPLGMGSNHFSELLRLSVAERIQLVEDLWDSVAAEPESLPPLDEEQQREIERRLDEHAADPLSARAWDEVRARLWAHFG